MHAAVFPTGTVQWSQFTAVTDPLCSCFMLVKYIHVLCDTLCINVYTVQVAIYITNPSNKRIYIIS